MSEKIVELEQRLAQPQRQQEKIDTLNDLAWEIRNESSEKALQLAQEAYHLSLSGEFVDKAYALGQATSLTTQAYLNRKKHLDVALDKCLKALDLLEPAPASTPVLVRNMRLVCWLYFYLGEYAKALTYGLKALDIAREGGFKDLHAAVLNSLTMIYAVTGEFDRAHKMSADALELALEIRDDTQEMGALNNDANVFLEQGRLNEALELANRAWIVVQRMEPGEGRADVLDTLGQILQAMGENERAEQMLIDAIENDIQTGNEWGQANGLLGRGKVRYAQNKLTQAEADFLQALGLSQEIGSPQLQMDCHAGLSQVAEQQGQWEKAFTHLKSFHELYKENHNETASKRLAMLKVAHQVETAKRDAEIYHLRNEELLREIEERKKAEAALEELAMTDPLTGLFNRRHFFNMAEFLLAEALRYARPLSVMVLDIDHFKQVNDTYGHAVGDEAIKLLAATIKNIIRSVDVAARFGGDEIVLLMPETNTEQALKTAQRLRFTLSEKTIPTSQQRFHFTLSLGVTSTSEEVHSIDMLLEQADRALYIAKQGGRNQVQVYQKT